MLVTRHDLLDAEDLDRPPEALATLIADAPPRFLGLRCRSPLAHGAHDERRDPSENPLTSYRIESD